MALTIANGGGGGGGGVGILYGNTAKHPYTHIPNRRHVLFPLSTRTTTLLVVSAKRFSSRSGRLEGKNRKGSTTTKDQEEKQLQREAVEDMPSIENVGFVGDGTADDAALVLPELPGAEKDFWEGPQWDALGFFVQYLWAFGIVFALIACGVAVATYNEGATDFKETPAYKESIQSRELLDEPDGSNSDVFESNPTEVAPSLE
ncbi:hypothetical protein I3843_15G109000 [Carya illinoinensis]|uniref:Uncharacterized protein n=1 Tax=Carya illinoinensis TaxID=32201 RepID=A0A8T1NAV4_CARIL|nr:uncharacterized protein LOC122297782 [Carya illinoinensis]KAG6627455.1 hypothetical protein CIPAW_15G129500 [Carya illinoinensis]KAG7944576.1 hypothetical protein I3843_15G109000 [Carya illinoinensis]